VDPAVERKVQEYWKWVRTTLDEGLFHVSPKGWAEALAFALTHMEYYRRELEATKDRLLKIEKQLSGR
jgi:hypothetical protein